MDSVPSGAVAAHPDRPHSGPHRRPTRPASHPTRGSRLRWRPESSGAPGPRGGRLSRPTSPRTFPG